MANDVYVVHDCKNTRLKTTDPNYCNNAFMDVDKTNCTMYPPSWKYCDECVAKGFKNPKTRKSTRTPEQIEAFKKRMAEYRQSNINSGTVKKVG